MAQVLQERVQLQEAAQLFCGARRESLLLEAV
jgi:hypothetical protein